MTESKKTTVAGAFLSICGFVLLCSAAFAIYAGFLSPMNRGKGLEGGAVLLAVLFGAPGAYLTYRASKTNSRSVPGNPDDTGS